MFEELNDLEKLVETKTAGAFNIYDLSILIPETKKLKEGDNYVEIGVDRGKSFACVWFSAPKGVNMYGIDINDTKERKKMFKKEDMKVFYHDSSMKVAKNWDKKVNVLLVDGNHTYEGVMEDCESWYPHMAKNSVMLFHDHVAGSGVMRAVSEWASNKPVRYEFPVSVDGQLSRSSIAKVTL